MIDFGYGLTPSSTIDLDRADMKLYNRLAELEPDLLKCMACGSCCASCSAGNFTSMNLRKIMLTLSRGDESILKDIRSCMLCGKCIMVCPRGINTRHVILSICKLYQID